MPMLARNEFRQYLIMITIPLAEAFIIGSRPKDVAHVIAPAHGMVFEQDSQQFRRSLEDVILQYVHYV